MIKFFQLWADVLQMKYNLKCNFLKFKAELEVYVYQKKQRINYEKGVEVGKKTILDELENVK